mmetsp:Transcript_6560/g.19441  ORF Transcript_6560/g.19441 Transcript_6560/m.19441 type:complete len:267 (+) Transcript_6560:649-1449(+)
MPRIERVGKFGRKVVASEFGPLAVAELVASLLRIDRARANVNANVGRVIGEYPVDEATTGDVHNLIDPELANMRLCPIESGYIAIHVAVVAEAHHFTTLVPKETRQPRSLHLQHLGVSGVERKVEHRVPVKYPDLVRVQCFKKFEQLESPVFNVARRPTLLRPLGGARSVPLFWGEHLILCESPHLQFGEGSLLLRALKARGNPIPAPAKRRLYRDHLWSPRADRKGPPRRRCAGSHRAEDQRVAQSCEYIKVDHLVNSRISVLQL